MVLEGEAGVSYICFDMCLYHHVLLFEVHKSTCPSGVTSLFPYQLFVGRVFFFELSTRTLQSIYSMLVCPSCKCLNTRSKCHAYRGQDPAEVSSNFHLCTCIFKKKKCYLPLLVLQESITTGHMYFFQAAQWILLRLHFHHVSGSGFKRVTL